MDTKLEIISALTASLHAYDQRDRETSSSFQTEDTQLIFTGPDGKPGEIRGRKNMAAIPMPEGEGFMPRLHFTVGFEVDLIADDRAVVRFKTYYPHTGESPQVPAASQSEDLWVKESDGKWRLARRQITPRPEADTMAELNALVAAR